MSPLNKFAYATKRIIIILRILTINRSVDANKGDRLMMFPRTTNAADINRPIIGGLDNKQESKVVEMYEDDDVPITTRKIISRVIVISFIALMIIWVVYEILFVLGFSVIPAKSISVSEVNLSDNDMLSFELKSEYNNITDFYQNESNINGDNILYLTVKKPIISKKIESNLANNNISNRQYNLDVKETSAVYYGDKGGSDKILIWKRKTE